MGPGESEASEAGERRLATRAGGEGERSLSEDEGDLGLFDDIADRVRKQRQGC